MALTFVSDGTVVATMKKQMVPQDRAMEELRERLPDLENVIE
jgi:hypothetical protein